MFKLQARKTELCLLAQEPVTSGSVNVYEARFEFSEDWEGLEKTAVFRAGEKSASVLLDGSGTCAIPWEVLTIPGKRLEAGIYGKKGGSVVLPTVWANLGNIHAGTAPANEARPPTPDLWQQELDRKGDVLAYDGLILSLKSGGKTLSSVEIAGGGGTANHRALLNRSAANQHPIEAISGLDEIPNKRVLEIWNGGMNS